MEENRVLVIEEEGITKRHPDGTLETIEKRRTVSAPVEYVYPSKYLFEVKVSEKEQKRLESDQLKWLKRKQKPINHNADSVLRSCDLFSGCGGITLGLEHACLEHGLGLDVVMGCDLFGAAETTFTQNFKPDMFLPEAIQKYVDGDLEDPITESERKLKKSLGAIDIVVGGPPCQGNSNLNNHTRRWDSRNELYMKMIRFVEVIRPKIVLIENVRGVTSARQKVVPRAREHLERLGYYAFSGVVKGVEIGIPQTRNRHFTLAILKDETNYTRSEFQELCVETCSPIVSKARPLSWAIEDLLGSEKTSLFDTEPNASKVNQHRMDYLHQNELWILPNEERPPCQQKAHTYPAVYGRMRWKEPAPTLTTGFGCNGRGKFTHPKEPRVLTPHEAARVQTFPDFFSFDEIKKRTDLHDLIGNAVPPLMASHVLVRLIGILN